MLFQRLITTILNLNQLLLQTETEIAYLGNWLVILSGQLTLEATPEVGFGMTLQALSWFGMTPQALSCCQHIAAFTPKWKSVKSKTSCWHWIWKRENGGSLDVNFTSFPLQERTGSANYRLLHRPSLGNDVTSFLQTSSLNTSMFPYHSTFLMFDVREHQVFPHQLRHHQSCALYSAAPFLWSFSLLSQILGLKSIQKHLTRQLPWVMWDTKQCRNSAINTSVWTVALCTVCCVKRSLIIITMDCFYTAVFSALVQTHYTQVACDSEWVTVSFTECIFYLHWNAGQHFWVRSEWHPHMSFEHPWPWTKSF